MTDYHKPQAHRLSYTFTTLTLTLALAFLIASLPSPVFAHHSTAMFDTDNPIAVTGVVAVVNLKNPHSLIYIIATDEEGNEVQWVLEAEPLITLTQKGWTTSTLQAGETVTAYGGPARNGSPAMILRAIELSDGRVMGT
ncbi:MAG: DUF6152 family protein [Gammaproteobacteria bacterium]|nr:DUF6152 family protein [Gammaproteobacteria bacterium]